MASDVFRKLNLKDQREVVIVNAPESFEGELKKLAGVKVQRELPAKGSVAFVLSFVTRQPEVDALAKAVDRVAEGDAVVWFAYPKQSSKRYTSEINRDDGWKALGKAGFEPVRSVAIDEDWSASRFRRVEFIKTMTRRAEWAMTKAGKAKASAGKR
jgi:hypothetical protein